MAHEAANKVGELARAIAQTGDESDQEGLKKAMKKAQAELTHAKKSADMRVVRRMLQAARSEPAICITNGGRMFDTRRDLLNVPNGTIELQSGKLREHRRKDYITRLCPTRFEPNAPRENYLAFLSTVFDGKPAVAQYVRALSGCVATGEVSDQSLNIFNGDGSNGKNVLIDTWKAVLGEGEYAHTAPAELLVGDGWERHPTEKTGLRGARLVVCSETGEDGLLDETKMKGLTGGDTVTARFMRGDFFQFEPTHKLILLTNNRPRIKGTDHGVWRRLRLVPFAVRFWKDADKELDPDGEYPERFKADSGLGELLRTTEAEGILADMVENAVAFYRFGRTLNPPPEVTGATAEYRADQDIIGQFFAARVRADENGKLKASELYKVFMTWYEEEGFPKNKLPGRTKFGSAAKRKFKSAKASRVLYAVRILTESESESKREGGKVGGNSQESAHAHAHDKDSNGKVPPTLPLSHEPDEEERWYEELERNGIAEFGGG